MKQRIKQTVTVASSNVTIEAGCNINYVANSSTSVVLNGVTTNIEFGTFKTLTISGASVEIGVDSNMNKTYHSYHVISNTGLSNGGIFTVVEVNNPTNDNLATGKLFGIVDTVNNKATSYSEDYGSLYYFAEYHNKVIDLAMEVYNYNPSLKTDAESTNIEADLPANN